MRSIPDHITAILMLAYWIFTLGAWAGLRPFTREFTPGKRRLANRVYFALALVQSGLLLLLYGFPPTSLEGKSFTLYFYFNGLLVTDMLAKFPLVAGAFFMLFTNNERKRRVISSMGSILSLGFFLILFWGFTMGLNRFEKNELTLHFNMLPQGFDGYRIVLLTDIHLGSFHSEKMVERMAVVSHDFAPDLIVFTGDLVNNYAWEADGKSGVLGQFNATDGSYAVLGNHDYGDYSRWPTTTAKAQNFAAILATFREMGFRVLRNESLLLRQWGDSLYLTGVENWGHDPFPRYTDLKKAERDVSPGIFRILLTHDPGHWEAEIASDPDYPLTLAGHTHGLQWGIMNAGIQFSAGSVLLKHWVGLYGQEGRYLYINRGMGIIGMPFRIDMPPEITLITLRKN